MWFLWVDSLRGEPLEFERANEMFMVRDEFSMEGRPTWYEKVE